MKDCASMAIGPLGPTPLCRRGSTLDFQLETSAGTRMRLWFWFWSLRHLTTALNFTKEKQKTKCTFSCISGLPPGVEKKESCEDSSGGGRGTPSSWPRKAATPSLPQEEGGESRMERSVLEAGKGNSRGGNSAQRCPDHTLPSVPLIFQINPRKSMLFGEVLKLNLRQEKGANQAYFLMPSICRAQVWPRLSCFPRLRGQGDPVSTALLDLRGPGLARAQLCSA